MCCVVNLSLSVTVTVAVTVTAIVTSVITCTHARKKNMRVLHKKVVIKYYMDKYIHLSIMPEESSL